MSMRALADYNVIVCLKLLSLTYNKQKIIAPAVGRNGGICRVIGVVKSLFLAQNDLSIRKGI